MAVSWCKRKVNSVSVALPVTLDLQAWTLGLAVFDPWTMDGWNVLLIVGRRHDGFHTIRHLNTQTIIRIWLQTLT
jgi:hypothetical protein